MWRRTLPPHGRTHFPLATSFSRHTVAREGGRKRRDPEARTRARGNETGNRSHESVDGDVASIVSVERTERPIFLIRGQKTVRNHDRQIVAIVDTIQLLMPPPKTRPKTPSTSAGPGETGRGPTLPRSVPPPYAFVRTLAFGSRVTGHRPRSSRNASTLPRGVPPQRSRAETRRTKGRKSGTKEGRNAECRLPPASCLLPLLRSHLRPPVGWAFSPCGQDPNATAPENAQKIKTRVDPRGLPRTEDRGPRTDCRTRTTHDESCRVGSQPTRHSVPLWRIANSFRTPSTRSLARIPASEAPLLRSRPP
jgi:hypothetical protein